MLFNSLLAFVPEGKVSAASSLNITSIGQTGAQYYVAGLSSYWDDDYYAQMVLTRDPVPSGGAIGIANYRYYDGSFIYPPTSGTSYTSGWGDLSGLTPGSSYTVYAAAQAKNGYWYPAGSYTFTTTATSSASLQIVSIGQTGAQYYVTNLSSPWDDNYYANLVLTRDPVPSNGVTGVANYRVYDGSFIYPPTYGTSYTSGWGNLSGLSPGTSYTVYAAVQAKNGYWYPAGSYTFTTSAASGGGSTGGGGGNTGGGSSEFPYPGAGEPFYYTNDHGSPYNYVILWNGNGANYYHVNLERHDGYIQTTTPNTNMANVTLTSGKYTVRIYACASTSLSTCSTTHYQLTITTPDMDVVTPTVSVSNIPNTTAGKVVSVSVSSSTPCYRMSAKYTLNGVDTWLSEQSSCNYSASFTPSTAGDYTVTVYSRSYNESDPRTGTASSSSTFTVYPLVVNPAVIVSAIPNTTVGKAVSVSASSSAPCYRMSAKYTVNGVDTWLGEQNSCSYSASFTPSSVGDYTVTVYARSYIETDPRSGDSSNSVTFAVAPNDTYEPNDTIADAKSVTAGSITNSYLSTAGDYDYWKYTPSTSGSINVQLNVPSIPWGLDYDLQVYEGTASSLGTMIAESTKSGNTTESKDFMAIGGKTYYFKIYKTVGTYSATSTYDLILGNLFPDNNEDNNTYLSAKPITPGGSSISSYISNVLDGDVWKFTSGANNIGMMTAQLTVPSDADFELQVYEDNTLGEQLAESKNTGNGVSESTTFPVNPGKDYFIKVWSKDNASRSASPYTLTLGSMPLDISEPNDTIADAKSVIAGSTTNSYLSTPVDFDYWKYTPSVTGEINVQLTVPSVPVGLDYDLQVYEGTTSSLGTMITESTNSGNNTESKDFTAIAGKTYYFKVYKTEGTYSSTSPYGLILSGVFQDNYEENDTYTTAKPITPGGSTISSYISSFNDGDIWKFTTGAYNSGTMSADLIVPNDADFELQVYEGDDPSSNPLEESKHIGNGVSESISFQVKPKKDYYLKVWSKGNASRSAQPYKLSVGSLPTVIDNYELNNTDEDAKVISPGVAIDSYISYDTDGDVWKFETGDSNIGSMQARLTNIPTGVNYELQVYEGSTNHDQIADSNNLGNSDELINFIVKPKTKYYVKVYSQGNQYHSTSPYTVSIGSLPVAPDSYESNNTIAQATVLTPGTPINSYISSMSDADYFYFMTDATTVGYMNIGLTDPGPFGDFGDDFKTDYDFQVYKGSESDANLVGYSTSNERSSTIEVKVVPNTKYYIKIYNGGTGFTPESYQLNVTALPHDGEDNDTEGAANNLPPRGVVESYLYKAGDVDYWMYRSGASETGTKVFGMKVPAGSDYELQVYPAGGYDTNLMKGSYKNNNEYDYVLMEVSPNTTYYMKVYGALGKGLPAQYSEDIPYIISIGTDQYGEGTTGGNDNAVDSYEVNNTREQSTLVEDGRTINSYLFYDGDVDYYKVRSKLLAGNMTVSLAVPTGQDYELQVYEGSSSRVWTSDLSGNSTETVNFPVQPNTNYYVKVYGASIGNGHSYSANLLDKYVLSIGQAPNTTVDQWITDSESTKLTSHTKWDESKFSENSDWIDTEWQAVDGVAGQLSDLHEYWENQKQYLLDRINNGTQGEKIWAQNQYGLEEERVKLLELILTGTEVQQSWAEGQLFIINLALKGSYGEQQWAQNYRYWENLRDYYQTLVDENSQNSWAKERRDLAAILMNGVTNETEWALDRWNWLAEEDYLQHLINENLDLDTVRWAQGRADLVDKILHGTPDEQNWARKRWGLLELIEHGTPAERDQAQYDLEEMDGKHIVQYTPMVGVSSIITSSCNTSSCMKMISDITAVLYRDKLSDKPLVLNTTQKCPIWDSNRPAECSEWEDWLTTQYNSYAAITIPASVDSIIESSSSGTFIDAVGDITKLAGYFTKGLLLGIVSPLTDLYDMVKNYQEIIKLAQLVVGTLIDFAKDPSLEKLSAIGQALKTTALNGILDLWNNATDSKYAVAETIGNIVGQAVLTFFTAGFSAELKLSTKIGSLSTDLKLAKKIDVLDFCHCFTAGTKVLTQDGEKPIEQVQLGDMVLAKNPDTGEMAYKEVDGLFQKEITESWNIYVGDELITTTDEHPFWIHSKGWVVAKDLLVGDLFETSDGSYLAIDKIEVKEQHTTVYNFRVKDFHTYYVSNLKILTHNSNGKCFGINITALNHSTKGDFTYDPKTGEVSRMSGGGHGQENIDFLESIGFEYNIEKTYSNGVRVGNVPKHKTPGKRTGSGQAWFPSSWTNDDIKNAGLYITNLPENNWVGDGTIMFGEFKGVRVGVIKTNGEIGTVFPDGNSQP
ncbi:polymorphic toxin-type HINT domain-containing protein [Paenibacillus qinlingensis]|nr:polymorphic toxin-type HINT domain-containing protein [Paenibacillus qinlingensis]